VNTHFEEKNKQKGRGGGGGRGHFGNQSSFFLIPQPAWAL
jgi:hypothetical protein